MSSDRNNTATYIVNGEKYFNVDTLHSESIKTQFGFVDHTIQEQISATIVNKIISELLKSRNTFERNRKYLKFNSDNGKYNLHLPHRRCFNRVLGQVQHGLPSPATVLGYRNYRSTIVLSILGCLKGPDMSMYVQALIFISFQQIPKLSL